MAKKNDGLYDRDFVHGNKMKNNMRDGTTNTEVTPLEFIEKLAILIPLPKSHTIRYFGVLSSNSKHREKLVPHNNSEVSPIKRKNKSYIKWADLLKRTFKIDIHRRCCK